jgi:GTP-binding protein
VHFHSDRSNPRGGPDGGDGGRGGSIILRGNAQLWTLLHLKYRKHVLAENGHRGGSSNRTGADGNSVILEVPLGTVARDVERDSVEFEITEDGEERVLVAGGRGGQGNTHFKSPTNQAPRYAQPGQESVELWKILELKILADVGLVGFPNAGKSTLLAAISAAKPKIADYAFTTLKPNLGIVSYRDDKSFVMADIPGIIEGAAEGKGLGTRFLRHIERNAILLFTIPADAPDINREYALLLNELKKYNPELLDKKRLMAITKSDLIDQELQKLIRQELTLDIPLIFISAVTRDNIDLLKDLIWKTLQ